ncbi:MAG: hypothetical protein NUW37_08005 [Planctomycetes bacterium]|nr:hypothetical protein [Planctomycetota bacterium]
MVWAVGLLILAFIIFLLEVVIPSQGMLTLCGLCALGASVFIAFTEGGFEVGIGFLISGILGSILIFILALKFLPKSAIGKKLTLAVTLKDPNAMKCLVSIDFSALKDRTGRTVTPCMPSGNAVFDGKRVTVMSQGEYIEKDTLVKVIRVEGNNIFVEALR